MTRSEFEAIIADIEKYMEGEGYFIRIRLNGTAASMEGGWQWLAQPQSSEAPSVIVIDDNDHPPAYVPLSSISMVQLSER